MKPNYCDDAVVLAGLSGRHSLPLSTQPGTAVSQCRVCGEAVRWVENDTLGRVPMGNLCGQRPPATGDRLTHAPHLGEHTCEILGEMGYGTADIEKLTASGAVACYGG